MSELQVVTVGVNDLRQIIREEIEKLRPAPANGPQYGDEVLSVESAARLLGVTPSAVRSWIRTGKLAAGKPGGKTYLISKSALLACTRPETSGADVVSEVRRLSAMLRR